MTQTSPTIKIARVLPTHRKYKRGSGSTLQRAHVRAFVDGYLVTLNAGKPHRCSCPNDQCDHCEQILALLDGHILEQLEGHDEDKQ